MAGGRGGDLHDRFHRDYPFARFGGEEQEFLARLDGLACPSGSAAGVGAGRVHPSRGGRAWTAVATRPGCHLRGVPGLPVPQHRPAGRGRGRGPGNGGDVEKVRALLTGLGVRVFAEIDTPGGGKHFYVAGHRDLPAPTPRRQREAAAASPASTSSRSGATCSCPAPVGPSTAARLHGRLRRAGPATPPWGGRRRRYRRAGRLGGRAACAECSGRRRARHPAVPASGSGTRASRGPEAPPDKRQQAYLDVALAGEAEKVPRPPRAGATTPCSTPR